MTNKTEPTNEQIAEALGWYWADISNEGFIVGWYKGCIFISKETPDFKHDNNASWEHVWPELKKMIGSTRNATRYSEAMGRIALMGLDSPNPALYFATEFMRLQSKNTKLKEEE